MKFWVYLIVTLMCFAGGSAAQTTDCPYQIRGNVVDSESKEPVPGASVGIATAAGYFIADEFGHFTVPKVCTGRIVLSVKAIGYKDLIKEVVIDGNRKVTIVLVATSHSLKEVQIRAQRRVVPGTNTATTIDEEQLHETKGGTLADALKTVPGVNILQTGSTIGKPVIQGLHSNRILILNNGIRQEGQQWGIEHAPEIDPFVANHITVVKGADAVRYGAEAIGGVILIEPAQLLKQTAITGELNLTGSTNGAAGALSGQLQGGIKSIPGLSWRIQGTAKRSGNIKTSDYYLDNTGVRENNYSGTLGFSNERIGAELYYSHFSTEVGIFGGSHIGNLDDLNARIAHGRPFETGQFSYSIDAPRQSTAHNLLKLKGHLHINDGSHLDILYGLQHNQREEYDIRRGGRSSIASLDLSLTTQTLDVVLESINEKGLKKTVGVNGMLQVNNNIPGTQATPLIPNYDTYNAGAYAIAKLLRNKYEWEAGVRYDHRYLDALGYDKNEVLYGGTRTFDNFSANIGGLIHLRNNWSLRSNLASAWRPPVVSELFSRGLHHGSAAYETGNEKLGSEQSYKWITSTEYSGKKIDLMFSVFLNHINNYIYLKPSGELFESIRGVFPTFDYHQTNARFIGSDLGGTYRVTRSFDYELKAALVRAKDISANRYLPWIPSDRLENALSYHIEGRKHEMESYLRLSHLFVARQSQYEQDADYVAPPNAYHLFNINAGTSFSFGKNSFVFNASLNNLTNKQYKEYMNRFRYYAHEQGRNLTLRAVLKF